MNFLRTLVQRLKNRPYLLFAAACFCGLVLALSPSCSKAPDFALRVGLLDWPPYSVAALAMHFGSLDPERIELVEFQSPAEASRAYENRGLDIVALTLDYAIEFNTEDPDHRVFLMIDESLGGDAVISHEPYGSLSELAGKRIGLEASSLGAHMLHALLQKAGLDESEVSLSYFDIPDQVDAYMEEKVDAMITYEPNRTTLLLAGGHEIFSSREIPGEIVDVFLARNSHIQSRLPDYQHFAAGWFAALEQYRSDPDKAAQLFGSWGMFTPEEFQNGMSGVRMYSLEDNWDMLRSEPDHILDAISSFFESAQSRGSVLIPESLPGLVSGAALPNRPVETP